jgi:SAM-dependent methyltransferase
MTIVNETILTYDLSAAKLAAYFATIGPRIADIELALSLAEAKPASAKVVEIGCGDGRDAAQIVKRVGWYQGFDPSIGLLTIAREKVPEGHFILADALSYAYPKNVDVIFAFASLLHIPQADFAKVCRKVARSLQPHGVFFISLKEKDEYAEEIKKDEYGARMFYYYNADLVRELAGTEFEAVKVLHQTIGGTKWLSMALRLRKN